MHTQCNFNTSQWKSTFTRGVLSLYCWGNAWKELPAASSLGSLEGIEIYECCKMICPKECRMAGSLFFFKWLQQGEVLAVHLCDLWREPAPHLSLSVMEIWRKYNEAWEARGATEVKCWNVFGQNNWTLKYEICLSVYNLCKVSVAAFKPSWVMPRSRSACIIIIIIIKKKKTLFRSSRLDSGFLMWGEKVKRLINLPLFNLVVIIQRPL